MKFVKQEFLIENEYLILIAIQFLIYKAFDLNRDGKMIFALLLIVFILIMDTILNQQYQF